MRGDPPSPLAETASRPELAGLGRRLGARFIDGLILLAVDAAFLFPAIAFDNTRFEAVGGAFMILFTLSLIFSGPVYETILVGRSGRTLGKRFLGIKVVSATTMSRVGYGRALGRASVIFAAALLQFPLLLVFGWALWDAQKQGLHDKVASTVVVQA